MTIFQIKYHKKQWNILFKKNWKRKIAVNFLFTNNFIKYFIKSQNDSNNYKIFKN